MDFSFTLHSAFYISETNRAELARFDKNYLPILFNLYTSGNSRQDHSLFSVLETIKVYLQIADPKVGSPSVTFPCNFKGYQMYVKPHLTNSQMTLEYHIFNEKALE